MALIGPAIQVVLAQQRRPGTPENPWLVYALIALLVVAFLGWLTTKWWRAAALGRAFDTLLTRGRFTELRDPPPAIVLRCMSLFYKTLETDDSSPLRGQAQRCVHRRADGFDVYVLAAASGGASGPAHAVEHAGHESVLMAVVDGLGETLPAFLLRPNSAVTRMLIASDKNALPQSNPLAASNHIDTHDKPRVRELLRQGPAHDLLLGNRVWHIDAVDGAIALHIESQYDAARNPQRLADDALRIAKALRQRLEDMAPPTAHAAPLKG